MAPIVAPLTMFSTIQLVVPSSKLGFFNKVEHGLHVNGVGVLEALVVLVVLVVLVALVVLVVLEVLVVLIVLVVLMEVEVVVAVGRTDVVVVVLTAMETYLAPHTAG
jgi:hypothetical protein